MGAISTSASSPSHSPKQTRQETRIGLKSRVESNGVGAEETQRHLRGSIRGACASVRSCLFRSLVTGLQQSQAISSNPFERQPNRHTQYGHHHRQHEQHRVVLWSEYNENVLEDEADSLSAEKPSSLHTKRRR